MSKVSQRLAVFNTIVSVLAENGITFEKGMIAKDHLSKDMKSAVNDALCAGFKSGAIELSTEYATDSEMRSYTSGLISNWLRKDPELNGGVKYVPANPGSRAGSGDPQMKALKALLSQTTDATEQEEIQGYIDARLAEIGAAKVKHVKVDFSVLPAELQERFGKN